MMGTSSRTFTDTTELWIHLGGTFAERLKAIKGEETDVTWYPYNSIENLRVLSDILPPETKTQLVTGASRLRLLDIGAADGDVGFFFESRGADVDFLDNAPTNFNHCAGLERLRERLQSRARIMQQDVDLRFTLDRTYDLAIALGILYHLRNPMAFLLTLALHAESVVLSTRVAQMTPDGTDISKLPVAYLLGRREANDDPTNYWIFSPAGLERVLNRSGWNVLQMATFGCSERSDPVSAKRDQRIFVYCRRMRNWRDLTIHHDF